MVKTVKYITLTLFLLFSMNSYAEGKLPASFEVPSVFSSKSLTQKDLASRVTVIEFWASWCTSCGETMVRVTDMLKATGTNANFIAVSVDEHADLVSGYFSKQSKKVQKLKNIVFVDSQLKLVEPLMLSVVPSILVVSSDGQVIYRLEGKPSNKQIVDLVQFVKSH